MALGRNGMLPLSPTAAILVFFSPVLAYIFLKECLQIQVCKNIIFTGTRNGMVILAFMVVVLVSLMYASHPTAYWGENGKWIFLILYGYIIFTFSLLLPTISIVADNMRIILLATMVLLTGSMFMDVFNPGFFSTEVARAAGFPGNANLASVIIILLAASALEYNVAKSPILDFTILGLSLLAIIMTQSRSGLIELVILVIFYVYMNITKGGMGVKKLSIFMAGLTGFFLLFSLLITFLLNKAQMFQTYNTRFTHLISNQRIDDGSSDSRLGAVYDALHLINESPLIGHGTGFSRTMIELPHNIYLQQWINNGILGLLSYIFLLATGEYVFWKRRFFKGQAFLLVAIVGGLFSHNMLDQRPFLILYGMLLTMSLRQPVSAPQFQQN